MNPLTLASSSFADDVRQYLQLVPRQLPSRYLYDPLGSALFDAICELPWYGITRAETRLLEAHRGAIVAQLPELRTIVELGPGDGRKLQTFVRGVNAPLTIHLIDVSAVALARAAQTLSHDSSIAVVRHEAPFDEGLDAIANVVGDGPPLVLFLGSNIGNFDPPAALALLRRIRDAVGPGGALLIGVDLVKPEADLLAAYDDPLGVSAAFNLNVLLRINRELGGNFDIRAFRHHAVWNARCSRMEMFAVSRDRQHVRIDALDLDIDFEEGEAIWTESSYKYTPDSCTRQLAESGWATTGQWIDRSAGFALALAKAV